MIWNRFIWIWIRIRITDPDHHNGSGYCIESELKSTKNSALKKKINHKYNTQNYDFICCLLSYYLYYIIYYKTKILFNTNKLKTKENSIIPRRKDSKPVHDSKGYRREGSEEKVVHSDGPSLIQNLAAKLWKYWNTEPTLLSTNCLKHCLKIRHLWFLNWVGPC